MIAAFETRDHGPGHPKPICQLLLGLAGMSAELEQTPSALSGDRDAVIGHPPRDGMTAGLLHGSTLADWESRKLRTFAKLGQSVYAVILHQDGV